MKRSFLLIICLLFTLSGCASLGTYNPATGRKEFIYISTPTEIEMGESIHQSILREYDLSTNDKYIRWVDEVGGDLAQVSDRQDYAYHFYVIEKDDLNAFTAPGGNIYVFSGLLDKLDGDAQLAAVLAHEIGHCAARHSVKKFQAALGYDLVARIALSQIEGASAQQVAALSSNAIMSIVFSSYSRQDEFEADRLAVKYMYLTGYDLNGIIETFEILKENEEGGSAPLILRTHPYLDDRIEGVRYEMERVRKKYGDVALR